MTFNCLTKFCLSGPMANDHASPCLPCFVPTVTGSRRYPPLSHMPKTTNCGTSGLYHAPQHRGNCRATLANFSAPRPGMGLPREPPQTLRGESRAGPPKKFRAEKTGGETRCIFARRVYQRLPPQPDLRHDTLPQASHKSSPSHPELSTTACRVSRPAPPARLRSCRNYGSENQVETTPSSPCVPHPWSDVRLSVTSTPNKKKNKHEQSPRAGRGNRSSGQ